MYQLSDQAIEAILKQWHPSEYNPPNTTIQEWNVIIGTLCDEYGIPDAQRADCAVKFMRSDIRAELESVLGNARARFGSIHWARFTNFMVAFDRDFREAWEKLPFYKRHPKRTGAALGIAGGVLLAPVAAVGALSALGFTSAGIAAGSFAATIQSIVYGGATGGLFSLLQSAGATMVLPSVGAILTGTAATGAGVAVMKNGEFVATGEISSDPFARGHRPGGGGDDDDNDPPPSYQTIPQEYILTPPAVRAIIKSWDVPPYNPPGTDVSGWLSKTHGLCEVYSVPVKQRALCAMHNMRADCREAANAAGCYDMSWELFNAWLLKHDEEKRSSLNKKMAEMMSKGSKI